MGKGNVALVDDEDYERLYKHKWHLHSAGYATNWGTINGYMHRFILGITGRSKVVDHINGDKLDNRKINLRICSHSRNMNHRVKLSRNNTSGFIGIYWNKQKQKWNAQLDKDGKTYHFGFFNKKEDAIVMYKQESVKLLGTFAATISHEVIELI